MLPQDDSLRAWAGAGALLAAAGRLGLPPLPWWPARLAAAPPAARVFLLVGLHPATAILLRLRLDGWLQPWQASLALWLGGGGALLLMLAAAGERHAARRAAWLGASHWSGLLAAGSQATLAAIWVLAAGMVLVQLQTVMVRWPVAVRRTLLAIGGLALAAAGLLSGLARADSAPAVLRLAAATLAVWVLGCWWRETSGDRFLRPGEPSRRPALAFLAPWARMGQRKGPLPALAGMAVPGLGRIASGFDRIVLAGLVEGLDRVGHGAGWLVAWTDRRGQDAVWSGASRLLGLAGRATVRVASDRPRRLLILGLLAILGLAWIGGSLG